jgi:hypothetical protein
VKLPSPRGEQGVKLPSPRGDKPAGAAAAAAAAVVADAGRQRAQQLQQERLALQKQAEVGVFCNISLSLPPVTAGPSNVAAKSGTPWCFDAAHLTTLQT